MPVGVQESFTGILCAFCNEVIEEASHFSDDACIQCHEDLVNECESCGDTGFSSDLLNYQGVVAARNTGIPIINLFYADDTSSVLCENCVYGCGSCGSNFEHEDNMLECCPPEISHHVTNYTYRPRPMFYRFTPAGLAIGGTAPDGKLYMGIELETAKMAEHVDYMFNIMSGMERDFVYFKSDASIGHDGVEIVTHPATLDAFDKVFPFDALDRVRERGARSYAYGSCGFHIHVNRNAFTPTHMWKFIRFQLMNEDLCKFVAQRDDSIYATWSWDESERTSVPEYVKGKKSNGRRYLAINFQNAHTVELRYFKGNILRNAILKNLQFVDAIYNYTKGMTVREVTSGALRDEARFKQYLQDNSERYASLIHFIDNNQSMESN